MNILIIDDDLMLRRAVGHNLLEAGHTVSIASNGQEAIELIEKNRNIDLIMVDVMMPVLTGPSFIIMLKKFYPENLPTIIVISGVRDGEDFLKKIDIKFDHFMGKPINFDKLHGIIKDLETKRGDAKATVTPGA